MRRHHFAIHFLIPLLCAGTLAPITVHAQKPDSKEQGRPETPKGKGGSNQGNKGKSNQQQGGKQDSGTDRRDGTFRQDRREEQPSRKETGRKEDLKGKGNSNKDDKRQNDQPRGGGDRQSVSDRHHGSSSQDRRGDIRYGGYFGDQHRVVIRNYYTEQYQRGHCPPGLSKKNNRCLPPGQAKKWRIGQPLPRNVIFYDLPPAIALELGPAPAGYRFVRVASDILMIGVGTGLVMDAIQDLGGL